MINKAAKVTEVIEVDGITIIRVSTSDGMMLLHVKEEFVPEIGDRLILDIAPDNRVTVEYLGAPQ